MKFTVLVAALLFPASAFAIDFTTALTDLDGRPIPNCLISGSKCGKVLTLDDVASLALLTPDAPNGPQAPGDEKAKRFQLALKIHGAKDARLTAEEVALIKAQIAKDYPPLIVGRAWALLDPATSAK